ncbi:MAG TPA: EamA family transporter [Spongiibacteraceae bacterium]|nr:EamA family transporter [Spongiibacteraceae bacterium]
MLPAYFALGISIVLTVISQTLQKKVADDFARADATSALAFYFRRIAFWLAMATLGGAMLSWLFVLSAMEVSRAYSLLSVNYVLMLLVSHFVFKESIPKSRWLGVIALLAGISLIVQS